MQTPPRLSDNNPWIGKPQSDLAFEALKHAAAMRKPGGQLDLAKFLQLHQTHRLIIEALRLSYQRRR